MHGVGACGFVPSQVLMCQLQQVILPPAFSESPGSSPSHRCGLCALSAQSTPAARKPQRAARWRAIAATYTGTLTVAANGCTPATQLALAN